MDPADALHATGLERPPGRLLLRPLTLAVVQALVGGRRLDDWAADYPSDGDLVIAGLLDRAGAAAWSGPTPAGGTSR